MYQLLLIISLLTSVSGFLSLTDRWEQYKLANGKFYSDEIEEGHRRALWERNIKMIDNHNDKYAAGFANFKVSENFITDLTERERKLYLGRRSISSVTTLPTVSSSKATTKGSTTTPALEIKTSTIKTTGETESAQTTGTNARSTREAQTEKMTEPTKPTQRTETSMPENKTPEKTTTESMSEKTTETSSEKRTTESTSEKTTKASSEKTTETSTSEPSFITSIPLITTLPVIVVPVGKVQSIPIIGPFANKRQPLIESTKTNSHVVDWVINVGRKLFRKRRSDTSATLPESKPEEVGTGTVDLMAVESGASFTPIRRSDHSLGSDLTGNPVESEIETAAQADDLHSPNVRSTDTEMKTNADESKAEVENSAADERGTAGEVNQPSDEVTPDNSNLRNTDGVIDSGNNEANRGIANAAVLTGLQPDDAAAVIVASDGESVVTLVENDEAILGYSEPVADPLELQSQDYDMESRAKPVTIDYRNSSCMPSIKDQGRCASSWAFTAAAALEYYHCMKTGTLVLASEQELIDCDTSNEGCVGGLEYTAWKYWKDAGSFCTGPTYPYRPFVWSQQEKACNISSCRSIEIDLTNVYLPQKDELTLQSIVLSVGPVAVGISANSFLFSSYSEGVFDDPMCNKTGTDHSVLIVGYTIINNIPAWIIRNSWGTNWGDNGYGYIRRGVNQCGIATDPTYPIL